MANSQNGGRGLDGRERDENGQIRQKNGATKIETLRKTYGEKFAEGTRSDAKLDTVLKKEGAESLSELLKRQQK